MPASPAFPHLHLTFQGSYEPKFQAAPHPNPEIDANRANPKGHANKIRGILGGMRQADAELRRLRAQMGLPAIPADRGFLLRLPEGISTCNELSLSAMMLPALKPPSSSNNTFIGGL